MIPFSVNPATAPSFDTTATGAKTEPSNQSRPMDSATEQKLKKAAGDFESLLLASLWKSMKQSFGKSDETESDPAHGTMDDWGIEVMSEAVGKAGGLGIGELILKHLDPVSASGSNPGAKSTAKVLDGSADKVK